MNTKDKVIRTYNDTAANYAKERIDELSYKFVDRALLKQFAAENKDKGRCADFGCGPGHTTKFLYDQGLRDIVGIDISDGMVEKARSIFPELRFETGDLLKISFESKSLGSAIAFYSIVHFNYDQVEVAFREIHRVLNDGGHFLFSFHVGDEVVHFDKAGTVDVDVDLYFFESDRIIDLLDKTGFTIIEALERRPYKDVEYQTRRGYIWAGKKMP